MLNGPPPRLTDTFQTLTKSVKEGINRVRLPIQSVAESSLSRRTCSRHTLRASLQVTAPSSNEEEGLDVVNLCLEFLMDLYRSMLHAALSKICHLTSEDIKNQVATALTLQFVPNMSDPTSEDMKPHIITAALASWIVRELCESRGGRPGLSVLARFMVSVDVKLYWTMLRHWSQFVPNMSTDIRGH